MSKWRVSRRPVKINFFSFSACVTYISSSKNRLYIVL